MMSVTSVWPRAQMAPPRAVTKPEIALLSLMLDELRITTEKEIAWIAPPYAFEDAVALLLLIEEKIRVVVDEPYASMAPPRASPSARTELSVIEEEVRRSTDEDRRKAPP